MKPFERRKDVRFDAKHSLKCFCVYKRPESNQEVEYMAHLINVSRGGLLITVLNSKIPPGTEIELRLQLPSYPEGICIHGRIIRTYPERAQTWYYSAIKISDRGERGVQLLLDALTRHR